MTGIAAEWQNGGMAEMRNGGMAEWWNGGMAEWRNGRRNDGMAVTHGLNLQILTAEHGSFPLFSQVSPAEWRNGRRKEWQNGQMAGMATYVLFMVDTHRRHRRRRRR
jgi:hypothetical protein